MPLNDNACPSRRPEAKLSYEKAPGFLNVLDVAWKLPLGDNKTDDPRSWALGSDVAEALRIWHKRYHAEAAKDGRVFVDAEGWAYASERTADRFRRHLRVAGVDRAKLIEGTDNRRHVWLHDLRATFITLGLAHGRTETWVADRTGHRSSEMINRYRRQARTAAELGLGWLKPMHEVIPELAENLDDEAADPSGAATGSENMAGEEHLALRGPCPHGRPHDRGAENPLRVPIAPDLLQIPWVPKEGLEPSHPYGQWILRGNANAHTPRQDNDVGHLPVPSRNEIGVPNAGLGTPWGNFEATRNAAMATLFRVAATFAELGDMDGATAIQTAAMALAGRR